MKGRFKQMVYLGIKQFSDPYYQGFAAQIAFYFLLAIVPIAILMSQLLGLFNMSLDQLKGMIDQYVSTDVSGFLKQLISYKPRTSSNVFMFVTALWAASRLHFSLMRIANYTFTSGRSTGKGFWRERFRSVWMTAMFIFTVVFVAVVLVYGKSILTLLLGKIVQTSFLASLWTYLRWPVTLILYFLMVSYIYLALPSDRLSFKENIPGSIFGAVGMLVVTLVYSLYANNLTNYDIIYGSLASIVALLFWFYFLAWALCLGILFNKVWKDTKQ